MAYSRAVERLEVAEGESPDAARKKFDRMLNVGEWATPWNIDPEPDPLKDAPWWWSGDDEASSSFLAEMGLDLT